MYKLYTRQFDSQMNHIHINSLRRSPALHNVVIPEVKDAFHNDINLFTNPVAYNVNISKNEPFIYEDMMVYML